MSEQEKKSGDKQQQQKPKQAAEKKDQGASTPAQPEQKQQTKKKKVNRLALKEVEKRIKQTEQKMGGLSSTYARELIRRKTQLTQGPQAAPVEGLSADSERSQAAASPKPESKQEPEQPAKPGGEDAAA